MKNRVNPTKIELRDLPADGREFVYNRETGEMNESLKELIQDNPYEVKFRMTPMGNTFDLRGEIATRLDLQCSLCATDYKLPVKQSLHELIVVQKPLHKGDQQTRANHAHELADSGPDYIVLTDEVFDAAEYVHEVIALAEPLRPLCAPEAEDGCANSKERPDRPWLSYGQEERDKGIRVNPFQVLEKMKLKD